MKTSEEFSKLGVYLSDADLHLYRESLHAILSEADLSAVDFIRQSILTICNFYRMKPEKFEGEFHKSILLSLSSIHDIREQMTAFVSSTERSRREVELLLHRPEKIRDYAEF